MTSGSINTLAFSFYARNPYFGKNKGKKVLLQTSLISPVLIFRDKQYRALHYVLILGLKTISIQLKHKEMQVLIFVFNEEHDITEINYNIACCICSKSSVVHLSPYYQVIRG